MDLKKPATKKERQRQDLMNFRVNVRGAHIKAQLPPTLDKRHLLTYLAIIGRKQFNPKMLCQLHP
jgi:hypothetical protein